MKDKNINITVLIDNNSGSSGLEHEHGWSVLLESGGEQVLFDCGQSDLFIKNSKELGLNINNISSIVLSHGHYDHTGGLNKLLNNLNRKIKIFAHPSIFEEKYHIRNDDEPSYIGMENSREEYERSGAWFSLDKKIREISLGDHSIVVTGEIPRINNFEIVNDSFVKKSDGQFEKDEIYDDMSIAINTDEGIILLLGCAHSGVINIIEYVSGIFKKKEFLLIMGGMHLMDKDEIYIEKITKEMKKYQVKQLIPSHCTGELGYNVMKRSFKERCNKSYSGMKIIV